jgi:hypothetical protein
VSFDILLGVIYSSIIISIWGYIGVLTFALYSTTVTNHHQMRMFYTIAVFNIVQAILGIYFITTGNSEWQVVRWTAFSLIDIAYIGFVLGTFKHRWKELVVRTMFWILVLVNVNIYSIWISISVSLILACLASINKEQVIRKYFPTIFIIYSLTTIVPYLTGFTTNSSLFMGVVYTFAFAYGVKKLYNKEKINDAINAQIAIEVESQIGKIK